jgi:hypothetical protein
MPASEPGRGRLLQRSSDEEPILAQVGPKPKRGEVRGAAGQDRTPFRRPVPCRTILATAFLSRRVHLVGEDYVHYKITRSKENILTSNPLDVIGMRMQKLYRYEK